MSFRVVEHVPVCMSVADSVLGSRLSDRGHGGTEGRDSSSRDPGNEGMRCTWKPEETEESTTGKDEGSQT